MALRITEQWIRERVKLKHDNLGETIINFMNSVVCLLSVQSVQKYTGREMHFRFTFQRSCVILDTICWVCLRYQSKGTIKTRTGQLTCLKIGHIENESRK